jgi:HD domain
VSDYSTLRATRYLPQVAVATTVVAVLPVAVAWWLRASGRVSSPWVCVGVAMALSLAASVLGSAYWKRRRPRDLFFSELLLWGWLRRLRAERQLSNAVELLGLARVDGWLGDDRDAQQKSRLLGHLAASLDAQDPYTDGHSRRVARHSVMIARKMGLSDEEVATVRAAGAVHDIGKLHVPAAVLNKAGKLTSAEFEMVKRHAEEGAVIVACVGDGELSAIVRHHHERFDGTGYPSGLRGEQIPLGARIVAVADAFDAMTSVRPYRLAVPHKQAVEEIVAASGSQLDPAVVRAFLHSYSGSRALVFWTLLSVSPQRAVGWARGRSPAPGSVSFGAMLTGIAAITAIGAAAISTSISAVPVRFAPPGAQRSSTALASAKPAAEVKATRGAARRAPPRLGTTSSPRRRQSTPAAGSGSAATRSANPVGSAGGASGPSHGSGAPSRRSAGKPSSGTGRTPRTRPGGRPRTRPGGRPKTRLGGKPTPGAGGSPSVGSGTTPSATSGGNPGAGTGGAPNGGGGSGGSSGGSGGSGAGVPTKDQCKNGGYVQFGFANQGQCVASVERGSH